ncbi:WD40-repeat-containing domain protein [Dunaliella salina]|uniref:WD40-repeat-containing domain protein n=1 Tax=Dunaliella salina TaxID=3046 RepID=A0ABQ7GUW6_DUNSA|nr:WD40-repeat-containing domain protein [Dunaliella salina]|eukprot:KAF5838401.1 WD40-repeat-containing domain protein [Dunaliella salina]
MQAPASSLFGDEEHGAPPSFQHFSAYGHGERVFDVQFSPVDSSLLATASEDMTVRLWSFHHSTGAFKQLLCCYGHQAEVMRVSWSADGRLIASGSADRTVRVWHVPDPSLPKTSSYSGQQLAVLEGHPEEVYHVEFLSESTTNDGHPADGLCTERGTGTGLMPVPQSLAGRHLLAGSSESLFLWDLTNGMLVGQYNAPGTSGSSVPPEAAMEEGFCHAYIYSCAHHPSRGPLLVCACNDGMLRFWALRTTLDARGQTITQLRYRSCKRITQGGGPDALVSAVFDSPGRRLAVAARDGRVLILDLGELQEAYTEGASGADTAALQREPNLYLLSHFHAPSKPFGLANLPRLHSKAPNDISNNNSCQKARTQKGDQPADKCAHESRGQVDERQHAQQGESQHCAGRVSVEQRGDTEQAHKFGQDGMQGQEGRPECSRALLVATVDGRVHMYDWDDPAEGHCVLSHPIQQQQQQQQQQEEGYTGALPALYAVAASSDGDAIAAAGQASMLPGPPVQSALPPSLQPRGAKNSNVAQQATQQQPTLTLFPPLIAPVPPAASTGVQHQQQPAAAASIPAAQQQQTASAAAAAAAAAITGCAPRLRRTRRSGAAAAAAAAAAASSAGLVPPQQLPWELQSEGADQKTGLGASHMPGPDLFSAEQAPHSSSMAVAQEGATVAGPQPEAGLAFGQGRQARTEKRDGVAAQPELAPQQQDDAGERQVEKLPRLSSGHPGAQRSGLGLPAKHTHVSTGLKTTLRAPILIWGCNSLRLRK